MSTARLTRAVVTAAVLALAVAGCGGGDGDKNENKDAATVFKDSANAICKSSYADLLTVGDDIKDPSKPTKDELAASVVKITGHFSDEVAALEKLTPPPAQAADYQALLTSLRAVVADTRTKAAAFVDVKAEPFSKVNDAALNLGFDDCRL